MKLSSSAWWLVNPTLARESNLDFFSNCQLQPDVLMLDSPDFTISDPELEIKVEDFDFARFWFRFKEVFLFGQSVSLTKRNTPFFFMSTWMKLKVNLAFLFRLIFFSGF